MLPTGAGSPSGALASWLELSRSAVDANVRVFRALGTAHGRPLRIAGVLKGNAYGHGLDEMLPIVHPRVDVIDVVAPGEALAIRAFEERNALLARQVLVIGAIAADGAVRLARVGVDAVVADGSWRDIVPVLRSARTGTRLRVHVHLDTGLGREGFTLAQLKAGEADFLAEARDVLEIAGVLSHFANTEDVTEQSYAQAQLTAFDACFAELARRVPLPEVVERHIAASAAALALPQARFDTVRTGISLYGLWPSTETRLSARVVLRDLPALKPVLAWRCPSQAVKWLPAGAYVGYGCTYRTGAPTRVAVLPVGYFDGYPRLLSGKAHVLVNGRRCPVLGRVMMNHLVVDVTHASPDERPILATLLGRDGDEGISAEQVAEWAGTIHYEIVTRLGAHLRRVVVP